MHENNFPSENTPEKELKVEIFKAVPEDVEGMQKVFYEAWLVTYPNDEVGITVDDIEDRFKDEHLEEVVLRRQQHIENLPEGHVRLVAKDGERVVGLCHVIRHADKNQLQALYVLPEYQGKGIGTLLWKEAQSAFDLKKDTIVEVASYNTQAINFYKKLGFTETGKEWDDPKFTMKSGAIIPQLEMVIKAEKE